MSPCFLILVTILVTTSSVVVQTTSAPSETTATFDSPTCSKSLTNTILSSIVVKSVDQTAFTDQKANLAETLNTCAQASASIHSEAKVPVQSVSDADDSCTGGLHTACQSDSMKNTVTKCSHSNTDNSKATQKPVAVNTPAPTMAGKTAEMNTAGKPRRHDDGNDSQMSHSHHKTSVKDSQLQHGKTNSDICQKDQNTLNGSKQCRSTDATESPQEPNDKKHLPDQSDVLIIGAGFAGLYMLHDLRKRGYSAKVLEAGDGVGGTWYWNRYPGARCDVESMQYSYSFSDELQQEWQWSERYATQPEILRYLNHVTDRFDLRKDIQLGTRVTSAIFNEDLSRWIIETHRGDRISAKFCVMATGCLSIPKDLNIKGLDQFKGNIYRTSKWPDGNINFTGRRVAVIGTGASGVQCIPIIAKQAAHLYVFQRTPNFIVPLNTKPIDDTYKKDWKLNYKQRRRMVLETDAGILMTDENDPSFSNMTDEERYEAAWKKGSIPFLTQFGEQLNEKETNKVASDFIRSKIREVVKDPTVAEILTPYNQYFGARRACQDTRYYETFNRDNVRLVDIRNKSIDEITPTGIKVGEKVYEVDDIVLAIGFDAITGAMRNIDIRGRSGKTLREKWKNVPSTFLGMMTADFPNLFIITGPGSPTELTNMIVHIEQNGIWIRKCVQYLQMNNIDTIEPILDAENAWMDHVKTIAKDSIFTTVDSWYNGANIPGKSKFFMPYIGGFQNYLKWCEHVASDGYKTYFLLKRSSSPSTTTK